MKNFLISRWLLIFMLVLFIGLPIIYTASQAEPLHKRCTSRWDLVKLITELNLTKDQVQALDTLKNETETAVQPLRKQAKDLRQQMAETLLAAQIDTVKADSQIQQMIQIRDQIQNIVIHAKLKKAQILTPGQRALMLSRIKEVRECRLSHQSTPDKFPGLLF